MPQKQNQHDGQQPLINQFNGDSPPDKRPIGMPSLDMIATELALYGLPKTDADFLYDYWLTNGFRLGNGLKVKDWRALIRNWHRSGWLLSQKQAEKHRSFAEIDAARREATFRRIRNEQS